MDVGQPSRTAENAVIMRALHQALPPEARVFNDPLATRVVLPDSDAYRFCRSKGPLPRPRPLTATEPSMGSLCAFDRGERPGSAQTTIVLPTYCRFPEPSPDHGFRRYIWKLPVPQDDAHLTIILRTTE
jgi:hypothetical protein